MNSKSYLHFLIGAVSLLLIDLVLAMPAEANRFTCRASALRVNELLGAVYEPVVANPAEDPCTTETKTAVSVDLPLPSSLLLPPAVLPFIKADALSAKTVTAPVHVGLPISAEGEVASANILGVVTTGVLDAKAEVTPVGGVCVLSSSSSVTAAVVAGIPVVVGTKYLEVPIPLVGVVYFNATLGGPHPTSGAANPNSITQRALWLEVTNLLLQTLLGVKDVVVGEATADFVPNPCSIIK